jgi:hypothetical protein
MGRFLFWASGGTSSAWKMLFGTFWTSGGTEDVSPKSD